MQTHINALYGKNAGTITIKAAGTCRNFEIWKVNFLRFYNSLTLNVRTRK
jgi:hypothetical protein